MSINPKKGCLQEGMVDQEIYPCQNSKIAKQFLQWPFLYQNVGLILASLGTSFGKKYIEFLLFGLL